MENRTGFSSENGTFSAANRYSEAVILLTVGPISSSGNFVSLVAVMIYSRFRCSSLAILCHHCLLDLLKSLYCFPFGISLLTSHVTQHCNLIGSSYVFLMTTSAYNFLALVVHEEYELTSSYYVSEGWCVLFGISIIWFMSLLLNLGVSIIPFNTRYSKEIGNCMFPYGKNESYVVHFLWISLVTCAVVISFKNFLQMYRRLSCLKQKIRWDAIHDYLADETCAIMEQEDPSSKTDSFMRGKTSSHYVFHLRRILVYICMITSFALFWYPLFLLTIADFYFEEPKVLYRVLTVFAWSQPIMTPLFTVIILRDIKFKDDIIRDLSSNLIPMEIKIKGKKLADLPAHGHFNFGIANDHFDNQTAGAGLETSFIGSEVRTGYVTKHEPFSGRSTPTRQYPNQRSTPTHQISNEKKIVSVV